MGMWSGPGTTVYLREWSADDEEMSFTATDRFDGMDGTYRRRKICTGWHYVV